MQKLLITRPLPETVLTAARARFDVTLRDSTAPLTAAELRASLRDFDAVLPTLGDRFQADVFADTPTPRAKILANFGVGFNHIDTVAARAAGIAVTNTGKELPFDKLAIATGADPKPLTCEGGDLDGVLYMRGIDDANALKERWGSIRNIVVIGGGFIGLEVAAVAQKYGKTVTVLHSRDRLMSRAVGPEVSEFFLEAHRKRGTTVHLNTRVNKLHGDSGKVTGVELPDGSVIPADAVMVGIGVSPRSELAEQLGLTTENGAIVVDAFARTSDPRVVASGDVALLPHPLTGERMVMLESVQNAVDQSKVAAKSLLGASEEYHAVPWFWSDQADLKLQMAGLSAGYDQSVLRGNPAEDKFSVLYYKNGRIIAVDAVNDVSDYMAVRRALTAGQTIPADLAADSSVALKTIFAD